MEAIRHLTWHSPQNAAALMPSNTTIH